MSKADVERINREHEDSIIEELRVALPNINVEEIRMQYKQFGDSNRVLEFFTAEASYYVEASPDDSESKVAEPQDEEPRNDDACETSADTIPDLSPTYDPKQETLSASMEVLSLNADIPNPTPVERETKSECDEEEESRPEIVAQPSPSPSVDVTNPKQKGRQRRQESSARKHRRAKQERKEAAKRRKQQQKMGIIISGHGNTISDAQEHSALKAIII